MQTRNIAANNVPDSEPQFQTILFVVGMLVQGGVTTNHVPAYAQLRPAENIGRNLPISTEVAA